MSISSDMVCGTAIRLGLDQELVRRVLKEALQQVHDDPNFPTRYAHKYLEEFGGVAQAAKAVGGSDSSVITDKMLDYWDVLRFLIDHL